MVLAIYEQMAKSRKIHYKVLFVVQLDASDLDGQKWYYRRFFFFIEAIIAGFYFREQILVDVEITGYFSQTLFQRVFWIFFIFKIFNSSDPKRLQ